VHFPIGFLFLELGRVDADASLPRNLRDIKENLLTHFT
jgi:hypothetical protein